MVIGVRMSPATTFPALPGGIPVEAENDSLAMTGMGTVDWV
jgi:hypothetical protein